MSKIISKYPQNIGKNQKERLEQIMISEQILRDHIDNFGMQMSKESLIFLKDQLEILRREIDIRKRYLG
ncbi:MAG: hypothetical protein BAJALOKI2v1_570003 [Promethearchaeota archaeon]|nr:MAG: hypothetical protein BAJALOKI2v1_570003 [Candidatus Lokiarchaeota archaeon]